MRAIPLRVVLVLVLVLVGCRRNGDREVTPDAVSLAPPTDPAAMPQAAQSAPLQPVGGGGLAGEAVVIPIGIQSQVTVHVRGGPPNEPVTAHLMTGGCAQPGPVAADLQPVITDARGDGTSQIAIDLPAETVLNGNHSVELRRGNGREGVPVACGELPAGTASRP